MAPQALMNRLDVEIQKELVGMRSQFDVVDFVIRFIFDPGVDDVLGEHVALQQEGMIFDQSRQSFL